ncbi:LysR family transcriptional regulator [Grimontia hollisae]|uniref:RuBisCO operon transcriptional regulator CbbR n=2 Tax=Grimontia hollisae TaxID=673 RepID=D0IAE3_GRIHO|nr:LysR family transcriptional regulator [Grimontia hollisae]AMG31838.1 LysR family transcriptional regulator [Grimontia hollisae]EEY70861.1 RuBisCO operon transcriptional regulator CbbR [Grimontia hollisae CIP 101886]MDF2186269.1 LysR family transcriptional regulator [Grimontia hollisae]STO44658.1 HTH-type transcriptional activator CmpR [Grimontia hollisae]STO57496.1 HTH-type transcriptional activator CmpR [Grimontia hollisae]
MHLTLRQLNIFQAVATHLSFTRAAAELHLTQPAVSMQIKQLEDNIGLPLFEHLGKVLFLTHAGEELLGYCERISEQLREAEDAFDKMKSLKTGKLKVTVASTANYFAARLLAAFSQQHPDVRISLNVTNREQLLKDIKSNDCDLVIMGKPPAEFDVQATEFMENPLVVIAPVNHPLSRQRNIPLSDIAKEPMVVREKGSGTRFAIERFFHSQGYELNVSAEMSASEAIKQAVSAGLSLGIVSSHTIALELEANRLVVLDVEKMPIIRHWYLVHRSDKSLSPIALAFSHYLLKQKSEEVSLASRPIKV